MKVERFKERRVAVDGGWVYQAKGGRGGSPRPYFKESNAEAVSALEFKGKGIVIPIEGGYGIFLSSNAVPD